MHIFFINYIFCGGLLIVSTLRSNFLPDFWFSVLTPYYKEDVLYSDDELTKENEDGISILFYLQKIYPGALESHSCIILFIVWN